MRSAESTFNRRRFERYQLVDERLAVEVRFGISFVVTFVQAFQSVLHLERFALQNERPGARVERRVARRRRALGGDRSGAAAFVRLFDQQVVSGELAGSVGRVVAAVVFSHHDVVNRRRRFAEPAVLLHVVRRS